MKLRDLVLLLNHTDQVMIQHTYTGFRWEDGGDAYELAVERGDKVVIGVDVPDGVEPETYTAHDWSGPAGDVPIRFGEETISHIELRLEDLHRQRRSQVFSRPALVITFDH